MTNDLGLCSQMIKRYSANSWNKVEADKPLGALKSNSFCSIAQAPFNFVSSLPFTYQWALGRASTLLISAKETDTFCDKFAEIVTEILQEENGKLWRGGQESPNLPCLLTTDNPFPPIIAKPHMEGYK